MPMQFRTILRQNRHLLHGIPAMGAEAIQQWAKARYGVRLIILVVQQTFGGLLDFVPHLHVMPTTWFHYRCFRSTLFNSEEKKASGRDPVKVDILNQGCV